ncbi:hypothetical protein [Geotalea sp. SG265]|uniref:hypothetical protein n=1 Tax=Geotalea sp. SG265 TaxID=2922867 RepID=UPI001FAF1904|nr:hypothetical protein [Geotalea sp. SG265]
MFKKSVVLTVAILSLAVTANAEEQTAYNCDYSPSCEVAPGMYGAMASPAKSKFNLSIGGYVKLDYIHNTNAVGPLSPGAPGGNLPAGGSKDESLFTAKQSRLWLRVAGPTFLGARTNALIETDFYGGGSGSNEMGNLRMRHAYGSLDWADTQVLFGQFWDVFTPAAADTIDFRQGATTGTPSNPRVPQIRLTEKFNLNGDNSIKLVLALQNPIQDSASAGANSISRTTGLGSYVNAAGQLIYSSKALGVSPGFMGLGMSPLQAGFFGLAGRQKIEGNSSVDGHGYGFYGFVPLLKSKDGKNRAMTLSLETQAYIAAGLDVQGATALAVVGDKPNLTPAKGFGLYGQLKFHPTQDLGITGGYQRRQVLNSDNYRNLSAATLALSNTANGVEKYNELVYGNVTYDLNAAVRLAAEVEHQKSQYLATKTGGASNAFGQNNVVRFAAYYFF